MSTDVRTIPRIKHKEAMQITAVENAKFAAALGDVRAEDWAKPTDCARWNVQALAAHVVGSAAGQASPREFARQVRTGKPIVAEIDAEYWWDGMNELHVREREAASVEDLQAEWAENSARALRARRRLPRPIAWLPLINLPAPVGRKPVSYLFDMGFTRDVWMHRVDLTHAAGTTFDASPEHDGRIIGDLVAEWAATHGQPFELTLTGVAGGSYSSGENGEHVDIDALEFCRTLAGRVSGEGVLRHPLPL
ncbi:MAG: hypothetical protein QOJ34_1983 [Pseudonocardiales bacterium]|jgi:uncharacterized protein (TIGR03083 family)|nr:hypothetical protein [Pseudonocardiales bacterium]